MLKNENRKNSLHVQYKLHKLLSRQGVSCPEVKLPKCYKTLIEHDRIMNLVWNKLRMEQIIIPLENELANRFSEGIIILWNAKQYNG